MKALGMVLAWVVLLCAGAMAGELKEGQTASLRMGMDKDNTFVVTGMKDWVVTVGRELPLRFGDVSVAPRKGNAFSLEMTFLCDSPDLAKYDTPEKMQKATQKACQQYVTGSVEKAVKLVEIKPGGRHGCYATFTDADLVGKAAPEGEHLYVTVGILRLTNDSALTFRLMSNTKDGADFVKPLEYVTSFVVAVQTAK